MTAERELLVGVVGLGFGERVHIPGWRKVPGVTIASVCARRGATKVAARNGVPRSIDDWRELVADPELDVVSIATPPASHYEIALAALHEGKAVLCEKPLAIREEQAEELARAAGTPTAVNFSYRALPAFRLARERIGEGDIGEVREVSVRWHVRSRLGLTSWSWKDSLDEGGGALAAYGTHALDYVEWLAGPATDVSATFALPATKRDGRAVTSDDACALQLALASGARASLDVSLVGDEHVHRVDVRGSRGALVLENLDPHDPVGAFTLAVDGELLASPGPAHGVTASDPRVEPFAVLAASLAAAVRSGGSVTPSFEDGLRAQRLIAAAHLSSAEGRAVTVLPPKSNG